jgi:hypothetical protein
MDIQPGKTLACLQETKYRPKRYPQDAVHKVILSSKPAKTI